MAITRIDQRASYRDPLIGKLEELTAKRLPPRDVRGGRHSKVAKELSSTIRAVLNEP
jgi:hypothetical protein